MIYYAIAAAKSSSLFQKIIVSTDDSEIADYAISQGVEVPFMRDSTLSDDQTPTVPVISDAIQKCKSMGFNYENVCCIYPAVPFLTPDDLRDSFNLFANSSREKFVFPITDYPSAIQRSLKIVNGKNDVSPMYPEFELTRTQDLVPAYYDLGQFYWASSDAWLGLKNIHSNGIGYHIPSWRSIDIDTLDDWARAELMYELFLKKKVNL